MLPSGLSDGAPISKAIFVLFTSSSLLVSVLEKKYLVRLTFQLITKQHQLWRLLVSQIAFVHSSDLLFGSLLFYHLRFIERYYGSAKYAGFVASTIGLSTLLNLAMLMIGNGFGLRSITPGPFGLLFSSLYIYHKAIPVTYKFTIFGYTIPDKIFLYILAFQLLLSSIPVVSPSVLAALTGWISGAIYTSDIFGLKSWRFPKQFREWCNKYLLSFVSSGRPALQRGTGFSQEGGRRTTIENAQRAIPPSEEEISTLTNMFPHHTREEVVHALQISNNDLHSAVTLLLQMHGSSS